jgi:hypothetical protein
MARPFRRDPGLGVVLFLAIILVAFAVFSASTRIGIVEPAHASGTLAKVRSDGSMDGNPLLFMGAVTYGSGGNIPTGVAIGDVDGDGKPDLIIAIAEKDDNHGGVSILLGKGDGTFQTAVNYRSGGFDALSVAIGDLNGDGKPDLVVGNSCVNGAYCSFGVVGILLGNGDGTFQPAVGYYSSLPGVGSVAIADLNRDGKADVVVPVTCLNTGLCTTDGGTGVWLGNGDGTLRLPISFYDSGGLDPFSLAIADVNGDGKLDLLVANSCANALCATGSVGVLLGNGDGTFQPPMDYESGAPQTLSVAVADMNGDGKLDLVVGSSGALGVLLGNGDGTFQTAATYSTGGDPFSVALGDIDGDGRLDVVVANYSDTVAVLLNNGDGTLQPARTYSSSGHSPRFVAVGDLNGDSAPDIAVTNEGSKTVAVLLNNSAAPSTTTSLASSVNPVDAGHSVTYTATVNAQGGGTVNGTVTFLDGTTAIATVTLANNQAAYNTSYSKKKIGAHVITASYSGELHKSQGSVSATLTEIVRGPSATALSTSGSPSRVGQLVTFTATVTSQYGAIPDPELVTFYDGKAILGTVALAGGQAVYNSSTLSAKRHMITATYAGDANFAPSSAKVTQIVEK